MSVPEVPPGEGLRLLSFDGGGIRSISQALMVREMMHRVEEDHGHRLAEPPKVSQYFDMICGSGFGGLLAIMCGILNMTGDQLVEEFVSLCTTLFSGEYDTTQRTVTLKHEMKRLVATYCNEGENKRLLCEDGDNPCKTFVCAAPSHNAAHPRIFRNYRSRSNPSPDCTIWEAACATMAMLGLFDSITIRGKHLSETFVSGELRWNNPADELTREATRIFEGLHVTCIISIGSGHPGHISLAAGLADLFPRVALDCERLVDDLHRRFTNTPDVFWRLSVEQGLQNLAADFSNLDVLVSHTHSYLQGARTNRDVDALLQDIVRRPARLLVNLISGEIPSTRNTPSAKICPQPTRYVTGRQRIMVELEEYFIDSVEEMCHIAVLFGIGGGGKTQIGIKFIQMSSSRFSVVYFVDASSKLTLENDLSAIAFGISSEPSVEDALSMLKARRDDWLLFFDNADDPTLDLRPYIGFPHGNILITTRNPEVAVHAPRCSIRVDRLELEEAKALLLSGIKVKGISGWQEIAGEIVQELGCLALAINQARAFLAKDLCSLDEYLPLYLANRTKLLEEMSVQKTDDYRYSVYTTWTISFNKLTPEAAFFIELLSFMHHDAIPSRLFHDAWSFAKDQAENAVPQVMAEFLSGFTASDLTWDSLRFRELIRVTLSFSLLEFDTSRKALSLHPLVQQWAHSHSKRHKAIIPATQTILALAAPHGHHSLDYRTRISLLPHVQEALKIDVMLHCTLQGRLGYVLYDGGLFQESRKIVEREVAEMQLSFGEEHPRTLTSMRYLSSSYSRLGQHKDALKLRKRVVEIRGRILGQEHPDTLTSMSNLASTYSHLGWHEEDLKLGVQVLKLRVDILGEEHVDTLSSMNNLASTYVHLGQHEEALKLGEKVLKLRRQTLGEEHPHTLSSMNKLVSIYAGLARYKEALKLGEQVIALRERILGKEHPKTLDTKRLVEPLRELSENVIFRIIRKVFQL